MSNTQNVSGEGGVFGNNPDNTQQESADQGIDMDNIYGDYDADIDVLIPPTAKKKVEIKD